MPTRQRRRRISGRLLVGLLLMTSFGVWGIGAASGGKGGGTKEPVPDGTIYFRDGNTTIGVKADGTSPDPGIYFEDLTTSSLPEPSNLIYGSGSGFRLWLRAERTGETYDFLDGRTTTNYPHSDLFVYFDGVGSDSLGRFQLTDLYGSFLVWGIPRWSNDGNDSFISFKGVDIREAYYVDAEGKTHLDPSKWRYGVFRIWVSGREIANGALISDPAEVETIVTSSTGYENDFEHSWSADGTKVAYLWNEAPSTSGISEDVFVTDLLAGTTTKVWDVSSWANNPRFSPTADVISFSSLGDVWTVNADGSGLGVLLSNTGPTQWSPDGNHVCFVETVRNSRTVSYEHYLRRYSFVSRKETLVTSGTSKTSNKTALPWVSNTFAP